jgi:16S rRNA (uracil1498-N3)-methyltransferase
MRVHRFLVKTVDLSDSSQSTFLKILEDSLVHQLKTVFRFKTGEIIRIFDGESCEVECKIIGLSKKSVDLEIIQKISKERMLFQLRKVSLAFALLKGEHTEMVLEKCTELGVTNFQPLLTDRTIKTGFRKDRLEKIIKEATEQSGFVRLPKLADPIKLESYIQKIGVENVFVMDMGGEKLPSLQQGVVVLIGPEGGWSESERELFKSLHLSTFSLAAQTLRAETACIVATVKVV